MSDRNIEYVSWNPWHGCTKVSPGCKYCYVYRQDERYGDGERARECRKTANFSLPTKRRRDGCYKVAPGSMVMTCFTSDFLLEVAVSGESGLEARVLDWSWVLDVRRECIDKDVPFLFHQTGANFLKDGRRYKIPRRLQRSQARKAGINYRIGAGEIPETVSIELPDAAAVPKQISIWDEGED